MVDIINHLSMAEGASCPDNRVCPYICVPKKIIIERTRDLIYLKYFFPKIISPSAGENSGDLA